MPLRVLGSLLLVATCVGLAACSSETSPDPESEDDEVTAANTTLTFPLIGREFNSKTKVTNAVPLDSLNAALAAKGLPPFKDKALTFGPNDGAKFNALIEKVEAANAALKRNIELEARFDPSDYKGLCYNGSVKSVMRTIDKLRGSAFAEELGVQAHRFGTTKKVFNQTEAAWLKMQHEENSNDETVAVWEKFDTKSDAFLIMTDFGPQGDGTELRAALIPKCK